MDGENDMFSITAGIKLLPDINNTTLLSNGWFNIQI